MNKENEKLDELRALKSYSFIKAKLNILNNPYKITFNPLESEFQKIYYQSLQSATITDFLRINKDAKYFIYFILYLIFAISCLMFVYFMGETTF